MAFNSLVKEPVINVFDSISESKNKKVKDTQMQLTPYQRYKLVKPFADSEETNDTEANEIIEANKTQIEKVSRVVKLRLGLLI